MKKILLWVIAIAVVLFLVKLGVGVWVVDQKETCSADGNNWNNNTYKCEIATGTIQTGEMAVDPEARTGSGGKLPFQSTMYTLVSLNGTQLFTGESTGNIEGVPTLSLNNQGELNGVICNNFNGSYVLTDGKLIASGGVAATRKLCPDENLMKSENVFLTSLTSGIRWKHESDSSLPEYGSLVTATTDGGDILIFKVQAIAME